MGLFRRWKIGWVSWIYGYVLQRLWIWHCEEYELNYFLSIGSKEGLRRLGEGEGECRRQIRERERQVIESRNEDIGLL